MPLCVHAPHSWSPEEMTTRAVDAPVFMHSEKVGLMVKTSNRALKSL